MKVIIPSGVHGPFEPDQRPLIVGVRITVVQLVSSLTRMDQGKDHYKIMYWTNMLLFLYSETIESELVNLETSCRYSDYFPQW